jgi:hypothetical protein
VAKGVKFILTVLVTIYISFLHRKKRCRVEEDRSYNSII